MTLRRRLVRPVLVLSVLAAGGGVGGCYERVVAVRGIGSNSTPVEEPYQESGQLDRWIFGDEPGSKQESRQRE